MTRPTGLVRWVRLRVGRPDQGRAIVEFVFLGVLLLVPLIYLVMTLAVLQAAAYSATTAAREAGRAFTTAPAESQGMPRARAAAQVAFEDFGFLPEETSVAITCDGSPCLRPDARVSVTTSIRVRLPYLPAFLGDAVPAAIPVSATHVATVGRFGGS
ncbi:MAG TPA: pilus assembly protein [Dermatophilaceae bacterium]|jgi:hypothetical protein|nr:pilus assembly protein [Dermatophilaceae bacterium]HOI04194.1 pilus assembly protein [Dermatophilaceae bacterium]